MAGAVVENDRHVHGYVWIEGHWEWNGYEWNWTAGRYEADPALQRDAAKLLRRVLIRHRANASLGNDIEADAAE
jgi:hypothetical protein